MQEIDSDQVFSVKWKCELIYLRDAQLKSYGGPKKISAMSKGQNDIFLPIQRVQLSRKKAKSTKC